MVALEIIKNAERLLMDGRRLNSIGSHRTAASLFVLSMEESGKACLVKWMALGFAKETIFRELRSGHVEKQHVYLTYLYVRAVMEVGEFGPRSENGKLILWRDSDEDKFVKLIAEQIEKTVSFR